MIARPGASSGKVICQNRRRGLAPSVDAAASRFGSIPDRYDRISRKANGKPLIVPHHSLEVRLLDLTHRELAGRGEVDQIAVPIQEDLG